MQVKLTGISSYADLEKAKQAEAIAASFARCSRSNLSLSELRNQALSDVESARKSNEKIVFQMGHKSIAEHVCMNFDFSGVSRLAVEYIEKHRLASFTERSQRYTNIIDNALLPDEFKDKDAKRMFFGFTEASQELYEELSDNIEKKNPSKGDPSREDSRYVLSLATPTQLGMTVNARSLERVIFSLRGVGLSETHKIAELLEAEGKKYVPSLIKYTQRPQTAGSGLFFGEGKAGDNVKLLSFTKDTDLVIASGLVFEQRGIFPEKFDDKSMQDIYKGVYESLSVHDTLPRAFELADFTFLLTLSSAAFAQLKRHRMMTILSSLPDPNLGIVVPESINRAGYEKEFMDFAQRSKSAWEQSGMKLASHYFLINAFKRRVLVKMNMRELCHFSRLRMDKHSQWEIRRTAHEIVRAARQRAPLASFMFCGKDDFEAQKSFLDNEGFK